MTNTPPAGGSADSDEFPVAQVQNALGTLSRLTQRLGAADYLKWPGRLRELVHFCSTDAVMRAATRSLRTEGQSIDEWIADMKVRPPAGHDAVRWPLDPGQRLGLQLALLESAASEADQGGYSAPLWLAIQLYGFAGDYDERVRELFEDVVQPVADEIAHRAERFAARAEAARAAPDPVTQRREFLYVADKGLRAILVRDYQEIQRAYVANCSKSVIILAGGAIEALLLNELSRDEAASRNSPSAPKKLPDLGRWSLDDLIKVAVERGLVSASAEKLSHSVREYRNLVHPGRELREQLPSGREEARIAIEVLNILDRDITLS